MTRVYIVVEGPTEESFVNNLLAAALWPFNVMLQAIILGPPGHKGGNTNYARVKKDVLVLLKQDHGAHCSTMLDFYGLGGGFPGTPPPAHLQPVEKVLYIEQAVRTDIIEEVPNLRADLRFLPYLQLHEYEGLLFSNPAAFADGIKQPQLSGPFSAIRKQFTTPEDINDNPNMSPSKRVLTIYRSYRKVWMAPWQQRRWVSRECNRNAHTFVPGLKG